MHRRLKAEILLLFAILLVLLADQAGKRSEADHREFIAMLYAPYKAEPGMPPDQPEARTFLLNFSYRYVANPQDVLWLLEIVAPDGQALKSWHGVERLFQDVIERKVHWDGRGATGDLPAGVYLASMKALARDASTSLPPELGGNEIRRALACDEGRIEQSWDVSVGTGGRANTAVLVPEPMYDTVFPPRLNFQVFNAKNSRTHHPGCRSVRLPNHRGVGLRPPYRPGGEPLQLALVAH